MARTCRQCVIGVAPNTVKTFDPECPGCQQKLSDGLRTGNEPAPWTQSLRRKPRDPRFAENVERVKRARRAQFKDMLEHPAPRGR